MHLYADVVSRCSNMNRSQNHQFGSISIIHVGSCQTNAIVTLFFILTVRFEVRNRRDDECSSVSLFSDGWTEVGGNFVITTSSTHAWFEKSSGIAMSVGVLDTKPLLLGDGDLAQDNNILHWVVKQRLVLFEPLILCHRGLEFIFLDLFRSSSDVKRGRPWGHDFVFKSSNLTQQPRTCLISTWRGTSSRRGTPGRGPRRRTHRRQQRKNGGVMPTNRLQEVHPMFLTWLRRCRVKFFDIFDLLIFVCTKICFLWFCNSQGGLQGLGTPWLHLTHLTTLRPSQWHLLLSNIPGRHLPTHPAAPWWTACPARDPVWWAAPDQALPVTPANRWVPCRWEWTKWGHIQVWWEVPGRDPVAVRPVAWAVPRTYTGRGFVALVEWGRWARIWGRWTPLGMGRPWAWVPNLCRWLLERLA